MQSTRKTIRQARRTRIRQFVVPVTLAIVALGGQSTLGAQSYTLDFGAGPNAPSICTTNPVGSGALVLCSPSGTPVGSGQRVSQSYGDVAGVVNVQYAELGNAFGRSLHWWPDEYNNLYGVLYSPSGSARIDVIPQGGKQLTLNSFLLGAFRRTTLPTMLTISDIAGGSPLYTFVGSVGTASPAANAATLFSFDLQSLAGFRIDWVQAAGGGIVAIDDLKFTVADLAAPPSVVPEPGSWALMGTGLAMLGVLARRRRV